MKTKHLIFLLAGAFVVLVGGVAIKNSLTSSGTAAAAPSPSPSLDPYHYQGQDLVIQARQKILDQCHFEVADNVQALQDPGGQIMLGFPPTDSGSTGAGGPVAFYDQTGWAVGCVSGPNYDYKNPANWVHHVS